MIDKILQLFGVETYSVGRRWCSSWDTSNKLIWRTGRRTGEEENACILYIFCTGDAAGEDWKVIALWDTAGSNTKYLMVVFVNEKRIKVLHSEYYVAVLILGSYTVENIPLFTITIRCIQ